MKDSANCIIVDGIAYFSFIYSWHHEMLGPQGLKTTYMYFKLAYKAF